MSYRNFFLPGSALLGLAAGLVMRALGIQDASDITFAVVTALVLLTAAASVGRRLLRRELGVDVIAILAMAGASCCQMQ